MEWNSYRYIEDELERSVVEDDHEKKHVQKRPSLLQTSQGPRDRPTCRFTADRTRKGLGPPRKSSMQ